MTIYDLYEPLPGHIVKNNLLTLTARVEQLEADVKRLEGVIISITEEKNKSFGEHLKAAVKGLPPGSCR